MIDEIKGFADDMNRLREQSKLMESNEQAVQVSRGLFDSPFLHRFAWLTAISSCYIFTFLHFLGSMSVPQQLRTYSSLTQQQSTENNLE